MDAQGRAAATAATGGRSLVREKRRPHLHTRGRRRVHAHLVECGQHLACGQPVGAYGDAGRVGHEPVGERVSSDPVGVEQRAATNRSDLSVENGWLA